MSERKERTAKIIESTLNISRIIGKDSTMTLLISLVLPSSRTVDEYSLTLFKILLFFVKELRY
jgi:hypothetical protein